MSAEKPYVSFTEFINNANNGLARDNETCRVLKYAPEALNLIQDRLNELGFRKMSFLNAGSSALAFQTTKDQIVRISFDNELSEHQIRPKEPFILQPIHSEKIRKRIFGHENERSILIEVLPKVEVLHPGDEYYRENYNKLNGVLALTGYNLNDLNIDGNIGLLVTDKKAIPVLIDCGSLTAKPEINYSIKLRKEWLDEDGTWLQKVPEKIENVIDGDEARNIRGKLAAMRSHTNDNDSITHQVIAGILEDGVYRDEHEKISKNAQKRYMESKDPNVTYAQCLKEEREALAKQRGTNPPH